MLQQYQPHFCSWNLSNLFPPQDLCSCFSLPCFISDICLVTQWLPSPWDLWPHFLCQISLPRLSFVKLAPVFTVCCILFIVICIELTYLSILALSDLHWKESSMKGWNVRSYYLFYCQIYFMKWRVLAELMKNMGQEIPGEKKVIEYQRERSGDRQLRK